MNLPNQVASALVLVGGSVCEDATLTVYDGTLFVEFEAQDLDSLAIPLAPLRAIREETA